jgi:hypothetical protein
LKISAALSGWDGTPSGKKIKSLPPAPGGENKEKPLFFLKGAKHSRFLGKDGVSTFSFFPRGEGEGF